MRRITKLGLSSAGALALTAALVGPAYADLAPTADDVVGVGSDTVQNIMNFVADGSNAGDSGYNSTEPKNRVVSFDATPDQNDRAGYLNGSTNAALKPLNPTITLRQGESPVQRPNGSSSGITALLADTLGNDISYVRASRLPKAAEQTTANDTNHNFGGLRVVQIATDPLAIATANTTNAPTALSKQQLVNIYKCTTTDFAAVGGTAGTIIPLIPQSGSGTRSTFLADLKAANGNIDVTLGGCVQTVEENDPTSITGSSSPANTIAPFSGGRINLYNTGYFKDPSVVYPGGASLTPGVKLLTGPTASDGNPNYLNNRGLYIIFRNRDAASTTPFQPGGNKNWAQDLFLGKGTSAPFVNSTSGKADIAAAGVTPTYSDLGNTVSSG